MSEEPQKPSEEREASDIMTKIMSRTGAQSVNALAGKCYIRIKPQKVAGFIGENLKRTGVPAMLKGFEKRMYESQEHQCVVARYYDGHEFWVPVSMMFRIFEFIDDVEEEMACTWIPRKKLEAGF